MSEKSQIEKAIAVLESIGTGDPEAFGFLDASRYRQHNQSLADGVAGIGATLASQPVGTFTAHVVRAFEDGDRVVTHTEYEFYGPKAGFDIFRFSEGLIVEHWDDLQALAKPNGSGHTMLAGAATVVDIDLTSRNKELVERFFRENILGDAGEFARYIHPEMIQHNPGGSDGLTGLGQMMSAFQGGDHVMRYDRIHQLLGQGNFVLLVSEGLFGPNGGEPTAFYDLFRVSEDMLVEHWDVLEPILPSDSVANSNGKF